MPHLKIKSTSQRHIHKYEDLKRKTYNYNANIYFNQKVFDTSYFKETANCIPKTPFESQPENGFIKEPKHVAVIF
jgi:hypothetical protein